VRRYRKGVKLTKSPQTTWFYQAYNTLIESVGEVKIIVVNKTRILSRILCIPGQDEGSIITEALLWAHPLSKLETSWVFFASLMGNRIVNKRIELTTV
jgi:hypothetical protein